MCCLATTAYMHTSPNSSTPRQSQCSASACCCASCRPRCSRHSTKDSFARGMTMPLSWPSRQRCRAACRADLLVGTLSNTYTSYVRTDAGWCPTYRTADSQCPSNIATSSLCLCVGKQGLYRAVVKCGSRCGSLGQRTRAQAGAGLHRVDGDKDAVTICNHIGEALAVVEKVPAGKSSLDQTAFDGQVGSVLMHNVAPDRHLSQFPCTLHTHQ